MRMRLFQESYMINNLNYNLLRKRVECRRCLKLKDSILKLFTNETIDEKVVKFCVVHNKGVTICLSC